MTHNVDDFDLDVTLIETSDPAAGWAEPSDSGCIPTSQLGCE
ncbi:hypothetical protein [Kitasatospora sp. NPDC098663]